MALKKAAARFGLHFGSDREIHWRSVHVQIPVNRDLEITIRQLGSAGADRVAHNRGCMYGLHLRIAKHDSSPPARGLPSRWSTPNGSFSRARVVPACFVLHCWRQIDFGTRKIWRDNDRVCQIGAINWPCNLRYLISWIFYEKTRGLF